MNTYLISSLIFIISFSATVPQLAQTLYTGKTRDLNQWNLILNLITNLLLGYHGYNQGDVGILAVGIWFTIYWGVLLTMKMINKSKCASDTN